MRSVVSSNENVADKWRVSTRNIPRIKSDVGQVHLVNGLRLPWVSFKQIKTATSFRWKTTGMYLRSAFDEIVANFGFIFFHEFQVHKIENVQ